MISIQRASRVWLPLVLLIVAAGLVVTSAGWQISATGKSIKYGFSQSQTQLAVNVESNPAIQSSQWSYAGPLDDKSDCSNRTFGDLPAAIKGKAEVSISDNNPKVGSATLPIQRSDKDKYYCLIIEGYPVARLIDYTVPTIRLEGKNHLAGQDVFTRPYGPSGTVDSKSWQAAVFDISKKSDSYACNADNSELSFRSTPADIKNVGQYSHGNSNHVSYNVPSGNIQFIVEFFASLENALYSEPETNQALIPFVDGRFSEAFTDNIHLCHRVSDNQGNTAYKLMRLDLGGPAIKLTLANRTLQASSPAVDLDAESWQYYKLPHRRNRFICDYLDVALEPSGETASIANVKNGDWYCIWALDQQGNRNTRLIQVDSSTPPATILPTIPDPQQEVVDPPETVSGQTRDDTTPLSVGQQSHSGQLGGSNEITPVNTDIEPEPVVPQQPDQTSAVDQEQSQVTIAETSAPVEQESDVALQSADSHSSFSTQTEVFSQTSETSPVFKYLMFIMIGLAASVVVVMFIVLKAGSRK